MESQEFWSAASAIAGIGVLLVTSIYAWLTHRLAKASEYQSWSSSRARVIVSVGTNQGGQLFYLECSNVGLSPAENLMLSIDRPLYQKLSGQLEISEAPLFANGLRSFAPGQPISFALGVSHEWLDRKTDRDLHPNIFEITARYESLGKQVEDTFKFDLESQFNLSLINRDDFQEFARKFPQVYKDGQVGIRRSIERLAPRQGKSPRNIRSWAPWFAKRSSQ